MPMIDCLELTQRLIEKPSVTPDDAGCLTLIAEILSAHGFFCHRFESNGVTNLWARYGATSPVVCLLGHTDVVPTGNLSAWSTPPFEPTIIDDVLYGRGASDMKSGVAAMVSAACRFVTTYPDFKGSLGLIFTSDEEGPATDGTKAVVQYLQSQGIALDYCLVGEPSCSQQLGDTIKIGRRGSLTGTLTVQGKQGHIAYPQLARNPIHLALGALNTLAKMTWDEGNAHFPPTSFQIAHIHSSAGATNVIPGQLEAWFNFRFNPNHTVDTLKTIVAKAFEGIEHDILWQPPSLPFYTSSDSPLIQALSQAVEQVTQRKPTLSTVGGTSDGRFIAPLGTHVAEFGVINQSIHQVNENTVVKDIYGLEEIYYLTLSGLFLHE
jgi:succinyl-diaminopimelate desuccinylase